MEPTLVTDPRLMPVLEELKKREPLFHRSEFGTSRNELINMTDAEFWEVGASGKKYSRTYVIDLVVERYKDPNYKNQDIWTTTDFLCIELAPNNYLLTYTLSQGYEQRMTRRATIWRRIGNDWKIIYHQGTIIQETSNGQSV